jgi:hypothetical protein
MTETQMLSSEVLKQRSEWQQLITVNLNILKALFFNPVTRRT